jgi:hypothetical protein
LGREPNIAEHDAFGFTIVPPEKSRKGRISSERPRPSLLEVYFKRTGHPHPSR